MQLGTLVLTTPSPTKSRSKSSPNKKTGSKTAATGKSFGDHESPWRIRVTVEAERSESEDETRMPKRGAMKTTTTKVPLKGGEDTVEKKKRGRPRKSVEVEGVGERSQTPARRKSTPVRRKSVEQMTNAEADQEEVDDVDIWLTSPVKKGRGRGRPRKSLPSAVEDANEEYSAKSGRPRKAPVYSSEPQYEDEDDILVAKDLDNPALSPVFQRQDHDEPILESEGRALGDLDVNRFKQPEPENHVQEQGLPISKAASPRNSHSSSSMERGEGGTSSCPSPEPPFSPTHENTNADDFAVENMLTTISTPIGSPRCNERSATKDPTDEHTEYDTIMESEDFSMISLESISSIGRSFGNAGRDLPSQRRSPVKPKTRVERLKKGSPAKRHALGMKANTSGIGSKSVMASSPPVIQLQQISTPAVDFSSPQLPPPRPAQAPRPINNQRSSSVLSEAMQSGIALQDVLHNQGVKPGNSFLRSPFTSPAKQAAGEHQEQETIQGKFNDLFSGFGPGTQRELRAGLRLGEELAERYGGSTPGNEEAQKNNLSGNEYPDDTKTTIGYPALPESVEYPALSETRQASVTQAYEEDDKMSWKADSPPRISITHGQSSDRSPPRQARNQDHREAKERQWQREREEVSRRIAEANTSKVIVIDSDEEDGPQDDGLEDDDDDDGEDIWMQEAQRCNTRHTDERDRPNTAQGEESMKPRRSKIPSPWRRASETPFSDSVLDEPSDSLLQPQLRAREIAKQREEQRRNELNLNLRDLVGPTPVKKVASAPERKQQEAPKGILKSMENPNESAERRASGPAASSSGSKEVSRNGIDPVQYPPSPPASKTSTELGSRQTPDQSIETNRTLPHVQPSLLGRLSGLWGTKQNLQSPHSLSEASPVPSSFIDSDTSFVEESLSTPKQTARAIGNKAPPKPSLTTSGEFSKAHYKLLRAIYRQAENSPHLFPYNATPERAALIGSTITSRSKGHEFTNEITEMQLAVVGRFKEELENRDMESGGIGKVEWGDRELVKRLFSLLVGEEMRRERRL